MDPLLSALLDWAPWLQQLFERSSQPAQVRSHGAHVVVEGYEIRVLQNDPRRGGSVLPIDPTLFIKPASGPQFFDTRDWIKILDRNGDTAELKGADQLSILDRLSEIKRSGAEQSVAVELRDARNSWAQDQGLRALHPDDPRLPSELVAPLWMSELDAGLTKARFDSGWTVRIGTTDPIGVVRQRGPVRVQLTVLDDQPCVQLAVWPTTPWCPLQIVEDFFGRPSSLDADDVIETAEHLADAAFAELEVPRWSAQRWQESLGLATNTDHRMKGPRPGQDYMDFTAPMPQRSFNVEDLAQIGQLTRMADTYLGGTQVQVRRSKSRAPAALSYSGSRYIINSALKPLLMQLVPDMTFFEFSSEGEPFYSATTLACAGGDMADHSRSHMTPHGPAHGGLVIDPRQTGRPGTPGTTGQLISDQGRWRLGGDAAAQMTAVAPGLSFKPTWDPSAPCHH